MLFAGAIILLSGGTLGLAFDIGMGVATVFGGARGAAALMRDPRGTVARYLARMQEVAGQLPAQN